MKSTRARRPAKTLVLFLLLLPALIGMVGLVIDLGLILSAHRQAQNAVDAAALSVASGRLRGLSSSAASSAAQQLLGDQFGLAAGVLTVNLPPSGGAYAGNPAYAEAVVTWDAPTYFISAVGGASFVTVSARAVAGAEARTPPQTVVALDPGAVPGLTLSGGPVAIQGTVTVNSQGAGFDAGGASVDLGFAASAVSLGSSCVLTSAGLETTGGVSDPSRVQLASGATGPALTVRRLIRSDPLLHLPTPTTATSVLARYPGDDGVMQSAPQNVRIDVTDTAPVTLVPGVYASISIGGSGTGTVTFQPGIYVLTGGQDPALNVVTSARVVATGVLFYNTGSDFDPATGLPDAQDGNLAAPAPTGSLGGIVFQPGSASLSGLDDPSNPFNNLLLYQRRRNTRAIGLQASSVSDSIVGTVYARWAPLTVAGPGTYDAQFLVGSMNIQVPANPDALVLRKGSALAQGPLVYLVE